MTTEPLYTRIITAAEAAGATPEEAKSYFAGIMAAACYPIWAQEVADSCSEEKRAAQWFAAKSIMEATEAE